MTTTPHTEGCDVTDPTEAALWASIEAAPEDGLRRCVLADYLQEKAGMRSCSVCLGSGFSQHGPGGGPKCPRCLNSLQNAIPHGEPNLRRCASCKTVWEPLRCGHCEGGRVIDGRAEMAAALRATVAMVPRRVKVMGRRVWSWWRGEYQHAPDTCDIPADVWDRLSGGRKTNNWADYDTAAEAIRDLCRAYNAANIKSEVPA